VAGLKTCSPVDLLQRRGIAKFGLIVSSEMLIGAVEGDDTRAIGTPISEHFLATSSGMIDRHQGICESFSGNIAHPGLCFMTTRAWPRSSRGNPIADGDVRTRTGCLVAVRIHRFLVAPNCFVQPEGITLF
jgi:hypothetical protein